MPHILVSFMRWMVVLMLVDLNWVVLIASLLIQIFDNIYRYPNGICTNVPSSLCCARRDPSPLMVSADCAIIQPKDPFF